MSNGPDLNRRDFLKRAGAASLIAQPARGNEVALVADPSDPVATAKPARWAAAELEQALAASGCAARRIERIGDAPPGWKCIAAAGRTAPLARDALNAARVALPDAPEALALAQSKAAGRDLLLASGADPRGLAYALLELADRVRHSEDPLAAIDVRRPILERPANRIRGINRSFVSDVEDKAWFNDRSFWEQYLSMLATQRFNRLSLTLGLGYNFPRNVTDAYFYFAYPFLVSPPGHRVRAVNLPDSERDRNLEMLRFISDQTVARGIEFQLAIWTHAYQWVNSPEANYTIDGLTPDNHAAYCRDALATVLEACPAISGVTFRVHGESGVPEQSYEFWKIVFDGIVRCRRKVEIDMHAKGIDQQMIDVALATGMPVVISPKYWAEHMGLSYHQAEIRELERPPRDRKDEGHMALSSGSRRFLRYGYGDLLREDRRYGIWHRIWPGTQRHLLWGDPALAAGYGRASSFCGSDGIDICEPLSFKGRIGSGRPGGRNAYQDQSLEAGGADWRKHLYTYRLWGRLLYNPKAEPEVWRRFLRKRFQAGAIAIEGALAHASRVLPLITTSHGLSGSNNTYWPEMYTNQPIVDENRRHPYRDTPSPRRFGAVSPFDPELFSSAEAFADEITKDARSGRYSPLDVAHWLEEAASACSKHLAQAEKEVGARGEAEFRRTAVDVRIQGGLARFFAAKFRSGVLFAIHERSGNREALEQSLKLYRAARSAWTELAEVARAYAPDVAYGRTPHLRGHWLDRLPAIDDDIADMEKRLQGMGDHAKSAQNERVKQAIKEALGAPHGPRAAVRHTPPAHFKPGEQVPIELLAQGKGLRVVRLHYRRVTQAERYVVVEMQPQGGHYRSAIPADYTASPYPLQYFFTVHERESAGLYPGFEANLSNQPYFVLRSST
jgi:hypothetical protein